MHCMITLSIMFMFCLGSGQLYELPGPGTLRSFRKQVTGSSQHPEITRFALSFAVDGNTRRDSGSCSCCAATQMEDTPWIQIDLGRPYRVAAVEVIGRTDADDPFNMAIYVSTTNTILQGNTPTQPTLPDVREQYHNVTFSYPVIGQFVTLQLNGNAVLYVCEVNIYSKDCGPGTYGLYCNKTCGQCQDDETCDHVTGSCTRCRPGFQHPLCTEECWSGAFGPNCESLCHCYGNQTCDLANGSCPGNKCDVGWQGSNCSLDTLISLNAIVRASSIHPDSKFSLSRSVDGSTSIDSTACKCCAATKTENHPWIQIDLGRQYRVAKVKVVSRTDWAASTPFAGMHIYLHEKRDSWVLNHALVQTIPDDGSRYYIITLNNPVIAQYVTLQIPEDNTVLIVCEVSVFSMDCSPDTFGLYCNETCGQCQNRDTCDHVTGNCIRCLPGYQYPRCNKACLPGSFGYDCGAHCHCHDNHTCDHVTGECPGARCDIGWMGFNCSLECNDGMHGENCRKACGHCYYGPCDRRTGECSPCSYGYTGPYCMEGIIRLNATGVQISMSSVQAGMSATRAIDGQLVGDPTTCGCCSETTNEDSSWWQVDLGRPIFLKQVIVYGRLNENIFRQLVGFTILTSLTDEFPGNPTYIQNGEIKDSKVVVLLPEVAARYVRIHRLGILTICEVELVQSDTICPVYTYGLSCAACGACKNGSCDRVTGVCPSDCYDGYKGNRCDTLTVQKCANNDVINGVIGAGVVVITTVLVVGLIVALFRYKKRRIRIYEEPTVR